MVIWYILLGILIGWVLEWLIDLTYWRRRMYGLELQLNECRRSVEEEREGSKVLKTKIRTLEEEHAAVRSRSAQLEAELNRIRNERDALQQQLRSLEASGERAAAPNRPITKAGERTNAQETPDDLKKIEGIGPKIEDLLKRAGIRTFKALAATPVDRLREILTAAGKRFQLADPTTWPRQARMAAENRWEELKDYQDALQGGRER